MHPMNRFLTQTHKTGYNHHIERVMVLRHYSTLTGMKPDLLLGYFMAIIDTCPWVMIPNMMGMDLHADGGIIGTKPYNVSVNYIHKMSACCATCL